MSDAKEVDRTPRAQDKRETEIRGLNTRDPEPFRKHQWRPADALPMPKAPPGWHYRYIRRSIAGTPDVNNFGRAMREGWEPVPLKDHPELEMSVDPSSKNSGNIEIGALILCKMPVEMVQQRNEYYGRLANRQMEAVDNNLMKENDPRMPLYNERKTEVTFGKGN